MFVSVFPVSERRQEQGEKQGRSEQAALVGGRQQTGDHRLQGSHLHGAERVGLRLQVPHVLLQVEVIQGNGRLKKEA